MPSFEGIKKTEVNQKPDRDAPYCKGLKPDDLPHKAMMEIKLSRYEGDIRSFLEYGGSKCRIVFGDGFYFVPKDKAVVFSVPAFREAVEQRGETFEQVLFGSFHEFAHVKLMLENDTAGRKNMLVQFDYEATKKIAAEDDSTKEVSIKSAYRMFFNVLEDIVVNHAVLNSSFFAEKSGGVNKKRTEEVRRWYLSKGFVIYHKKENKTSPEDFGEPYTAEEIAQGIDWKDVEPENLKKRGQFVSFVIKSEMTQAPGLLQSDIYHLEKNPEGITKLDEDVASALVLPLKDAYRYLLEKVIEKIKSDPEGGKKYFDFLSKSVVVPLYKKVNGKNVVEREDVYFNVCESQGDNVDGFSIGFASANFSLELRREMNQLGYKTDKLTFLDLVRIFKETEIAKKGSGTRQFRLNLPERTHLMRKYLEPIFSMLCILDDSFKANVADQNPGGGGDGGQGGGESGPSAEDFEFKPGMKVRNKLNGKKGIISDVKTENGVVVSVTIEYFEEGVQKQISEDENLSGESEEIFDPFSNLKVITKKQGKGKSKKGKKPPVEYEFEGEEEEKDEDDDDEDEDDDEDNEDGDESSDEGDDKEGKDEDGQDGTDSGQPTKDPIEDGYQRGLEEFKKMLEDLEEQEDIEQNLEKLKAAHQSEKIRGIKEREKEFKDIMKKIDERSRIEPIPVDRDKLSMQVTEYLDSMEVLRPHFNKMAEAWLKILNNISSQIEMIRTRYFISGKMDFRKAQRYLDFIEAGHDLSNMNLYERFVEKISVDLKPKALRVGAILDNSISMNEGKINALKMALLLLMGSLRDLKILFKSSMQDVLGQNTYCDIQIDTQLQIFSSVDKQHSKIVKPFSLHVKELIDGENDNGDVNAEIADFIIATSHLGVDRAGTDPSEAMSQFFLSHSGADFDLIKNREITEILFLVTDGAFDNEKSEIKTQAIADSLRKKGVVVGGLSIGDSSAETLLKKLFGDEMVAKSDTPEELAEKFGTLLEKLVKETFEKPMIEYLDKFQKGLEREL
jgi:hypothetical protein